MFLSLKKLAGKYAASYVPLGLFKLDQANMESFLVVHTTHYANMRSVAAEFVDSKCGALKRQIILVMAAIRYALMKNAPPGRRYAQDVVRK
jgi:hypothetical protein